jgi:Tfp pilus assembly protein PilE
MKEGSRANALLVELLLVIFFFMISAAILVQVYGDAKLKSRTAAATNSAMLDGQNVAEELYGTDDPEAVLTADGFTSEGDVWVLEKKGYVLKVTPKIEETDSGTLRTYEVAGIEGEKTLITLPSTRFIPKEVSP